MGYSNFYLLYTRCILLVKHRFRIKLFRKYLLHLLKELLSTQYNQSQNLFLHLVSLLSIHQIALNGSFLQFIFKRKGKERAEPRVWSFCHRVHKQQQHPLIHHACNNLRRAGMVFFPSQHSTSKNVLPLWYDTNERNNLRDWLSPLKNNSKPIWCW